MQMEISGSTSYGSALMVASLAKKQQTQEGQTALALLQGAAESAQAPKSTAGSTLGSNINIHV
jgi:hypothetical protein